MSGANALGRFAGKTHVLPISVYYEDTDLSGVVYHANYLRYMERGRTEFFRLAGISKMAGLEDDEPTAWAIRSIAVDYHRPASGGPLHIHARVVKIGRTLSVADSEVRSPDDVLLASGRGSYLMRDGGIAT